MLKQIFGLWLVMLVSPGMVASQNQSPSCSSTELYGQLDFWVGSWDVYANDQKVGTNRIEKVLSGCAILEHWTSARGTKGKSMFYVSPEDNNWKQVWVTQGAMRPGGTKEKHLIAVYENGAVRFQGEYQRSGTRVLDRTTLTPISPDSVRQHIQTSTDGGDTWGPGFNALYVRIKSN